MAEPRQPPPARKMNQGRHHSPDAVRGRREGVRRFCLRKLPAKKFVVEQANMDFENHVCGKNIPLLNRPGGRLKPLPDVVRIEPALTERGSRVDNMKLEAGPVGAILQG